MVDFRTLIELQGQIFLLVLAGVFFRRKLVGEEFQRDFSTLMVDLILPCNILSSFQIELTREMAGRTLQIFVISLAGQLLALAVGRILFTYTDPDRRAVMKYTLICSNASFLGIPIAGGIWGAEGVLLTSVFLIPQRVVMWTVGLSWFSRGEGKGVLKKLLTNTCMVAVCIGLLLMFTGLRLPGVFRSAVDSISRCTTGMSMFMVGMMISHVHWRDFLDKDVLSLTVLRLLLFPAALWLGCRISGADSLAAGVAALLSAMPVGATTAVLASRYRRAEEYAADLVTVSTMISLITIPLWGLFVT